MVKKRKRLFLSYILLKKINLIIICMLISIIFLSCKEILNTNSSGELKHSVQLKSEHRTYKVKKGSIVKTINSGGMVVSGIQQDLSFQIEGHSLKSIKAAQEQAVNKGQVLAELEACDIENELKEREIKLKIIELEVEKLKANNADNYKIEKAKLEVELEKVEVSKSKTKLSKTKLISNIDGVITHINNIRIGDIVPQDVPIITIANADNLMIEYYGNNVQLLKVGMNATIECNGKKIKSKVISNPTNPSDKGVLGSSASQAFILGASSSDASGPNKMIAYISAKGLKGYAKIGDSAKIYINLVKKDDVIVIPLSTIHQFNNTYYVNVMEDGMKVEKTVDVGIADNINIEIINGLKEGEEVIID